MSRVYVRCPQCDGKECTDISCKFSGIKHKDAAPQAESPPSDSYGHVGTCSAPNMPPAVAAPYGDIGYEAAWTGVPT
jgi:hypothetical protein